MADRSQPDSAALYTVTPEERVYRIACAPSPWSWPDWANVGVDQTFGNRWDDSEGVYRVLYASSSRLGAFVEVLSRFRPDLVLMKELAEIEDDDDGGATELSGELHVSWLDNRLMGVGRFHSDFVDIGHSSSLVHVRWALAPRIIHHGLEDLDAAAIRQTAPRRFTQEISRYVYDQSTPEGQRRFAGITYLSKLGDEFRNWALFETAGGETALEEESEARAIEADDPDLNQALNLLDIRLVGV